MCQRTVMEREEVIKSLRACLLCSKGGTSLESLSHEYREILGDPIPFKRLGFLTLVAFLQDIPTIRVFNKGGQCFVESVTMQETAHLVKLVQQQKTSSKKSKKRGTTYSTHSLRKPVNFQAPRSSIHQINSTSRPSNVSYLNEPVYLHARPVISTMQENRDPAVGRNIPTFNGGVRQPSPAVPTTRVTFDRPSNVSHAFHIPQVPQIPRIPLIPSNQQVPQVPPNVKRAVSQVPIAATPDPREELAKCAAAMNLPEPVYDIRSIANQIFVILKVGEESCKTYPDRGAATVDEAQKIAAKIALQDITKKFGATANINVQADKNMVMQRVSSIINNYANGVFMHQIPVLYKQQYKAHLPTDWETTLQQCPSITLEQGPQTPEHDRSISFFKPVSPGLLKLPEDTHWIVCVSYLKSTTEVYARVVDDADNEKFTALTTEMREHYDKIQTPTKKPLIQIGNYYALFQDDSWNRVQCIDRNSENGLEDFCDCDTIISEVEKLLLDKAFYGEVKSQDTIDDRPSATVFFYDTNGPEATDDNISKVLKPPKISSLSRIHTRLSKASWNLQLMVKKLPRESACT